MKFDLQKASFSDEEDLPPPSKNLIDLQNAQHGLILKETTKFYSQCKDFIYKFMAMSSSGFPCNAPFLLNRLMVMENSALKVSAKEEPLWRWGKSKQETEDSFYSILTRMGQVIEDIIKFQAQVQAKGAVLRESNVKSRKKSFTLIRRESIEEQDKQNIKQEKILRQILTKNMAPLKKEQQQVCSSRLSAGQNLELLKQKVERLSQGIRNTKQKQQRVWQIFEQRRPSRHPNEEIGNTDTDYQKIKDWLSSLKKTDSSESALNITSQ